MALFILALLAGSLGLYYGADRLVAGSSAISMRTGISPMLVGLTVVAFATSSPELIVSLKAAFQGNPSIAVGNVVGSNIANIGLVLGLTALIYPVKTQSQTLRFDMPVMIGVVFVMFVLMYNHMFTRGEGIFLTTLLVAFILLLIWMAKNNRYTVDESQVEEIKQSASIKTWIAVVYIIVGTVLLIVASDWFLYGATGLGQILGISDAVIGLTLVSVGTSLPELATSLVAAFKKQTDMALGNVIGSNIFNVLAVLGITATIHPLSGGDITWIDLGVMLAFSVLLWPLMRHKYLLNRTKAGFLFAGYIGYMWYLFG